MNYDAGIHRVVLRVTKITDAMLGIGTNPFYRRNKACPYCWQPMTPSKKNERIPTRDHVVPTSKGGPDVLGNIIVVCRTCNQDKADLSLPEFLGALMARNDTRAQCVRLVIDHITQDFNAEEQGMIWGDVGAGYAQEKRSARSAARVQEKKNRQQKTYENVFNIMVSLGLPRTHWTLVPPATLRVLIGPYSQTFDAECPRLRQDIADLLVRRLAPTRFIEAAQ